MIISGESGAVNSQYRVDFPRYFILFFLYQLFSILCEGQDWSVKTDPGLYRICKRQPRGRKSCQRDILREQPDSKFSKKLSFVIFYDSTIIDSWNHSGMPKLLEITTLHDSESILNCSLIASGAPKAVSGVVTTYYPHITIAFIPYYQRVKWNEM